MNEYWLPLSILSRSRLFAVTSQYSPHRSCLHWIIDGADIFCLERRFIHALKVFSTVADLGREEKLLRVETAKGPQQASAKWAHMQTGIWGPLKGPELSEAYTILKYILLLF